MPGLKFINMVGPRHPPGLRLLEGATNAEIYGCLIYYNGWEAPDRGHGHGIYAQNQTGTKKITDNIVFSGSATSSTSTAPTAPISTTSTSRATRLQRGQTSTGGGRNLLLGGDSVAHNPSSRTTTCTACRRPDLRASTSATTAGCSNATVTNNYIANNDLLRQLPAHHA